MPRSNFDTINYCEEIIDEKSRKHTVGCVADPGRIATPSEHQFFWQRFDIAYTGNRSWYPAIGGSRKGQIIPESGSAPLMRMVDTVRPIAFAENQLSRSWSCAWSACHSSGRFALAKPLTDPEMADECLNCL